MSTSMVLAQAATQAATMMEAATKAAEVSPGIHLGKVDYAVLIIYFLFVLGIGFVIKRFTKTSTDFFLSGRSLPAWICGLAFISANLGAQEVIGMGASGAQYGIMTSHFYWVGAIPAMVFIGIFMMPFYYGSKARSVPEYLKFRFDDKTRGFNAFTFLVMTVFSSGISMYALAKLLELLLGWNFDASLWISAAIVLVYITLGGLTSAIYNEVLQFFLIVLGFIPLVFLGLKDAGGWHGLMDRLNTVSQAREFEPGTYTSSWAHMGSPADNPMGVEWFGMVFGLGFVLSFAYWCTDFLVVQRAMAAKNMSAARRTPIIAAIPKMFFPILVILPGMVAIALTYKAGTSGFELPRKGDSFDYDLAVPMMLGHYLPSGLLGLGLTALMASFMSGMAGNVTAFNTVWTYDIYQSYIGKNKSDGHYLMVGRITTVVGILISIGAAYFANQFNNIMNVLQLVFGFVNAPLLATFLLGMFWKRSTGHGAFFGLLSGTLAAVIHYGLALPRSALSAAAAKLHTVLPADPLQASPDVIKEAAGVAGGWFNSFGIKPIHVYPAPMAANFWLAIYAFSTCFIVTLVVSLLTRKVKSDEELKGLVYSLTPKIKEHDVPWYKQPATFGIIVLLAAIVLNIIFW